MIYTDLGMMATVATTWEECGGRRFQGAVLAYRLGGRDIGEVLAMSVSEAGTFLGAGEARIPAAHAILRRLAGVGLGYLRPGEPLTTHHRPRARRRPRRRPGVFEGTPADLVAARATLTGEHLAADVGGPAAGGG